MNQITPPRRGMSSQSGISTASTIPTSQHNTTQSYDTTPTSKNSRTTSTTRPLIKHKKQSVDTTTDSSSFDDNGRFSPKKLVLPRHIGGGSSTVHNSNASVCSTGGVSTTSSRNNNHNRFSNSFTSGMSPTNGSKTVLVPSSSSSVSGGSVAAPPSSERKTKIQVCVRVRPILPNDNKKPSVGNNNNTTNNNQRRNSLHRKSRPNVPPSTSSLQAALHNSIMTDPTSTPNPAWVVQPDHRSICQDATLTPDSTRTNTYKFDHCFDPTQTTQDLYDATVKDAVNAFMEGYHTSVFAYGQTATGKTFTMTGNPSSSDEKNSRGIVQLAIQDCFDYIHDERGDGGGREYLLRVSFMEIYNEVVNDLLIDSDSSTSSSGVPPSSSSSRFHTKSPALPTASTSNVRIFESKREGVIIRGLKEQIVTSYADVLALLAAGERRRQIGSTQLNKQSSRSHSIFRLTVESRQRPGSAQRIRKPKLESQVSSGTTGSGGSESIASGAFKGGKSLGPVRVSTLSLVDLAGSESVKNTGSTGTRQKEGQYINKSLLTLGHVVWKLAELSSKKADGGIDTTHIPYRDSKLTRLLQPSLSGRAQIVLICNISPVVKHLEESHNTLQFASRAKRIKQNAVVTEVLNEKTLLQNYREEIDDLKRQLADAKKNMKSSDNENGSRNGGASGANVGDGEEMDIIVQAIHNLERLILTTTTAQERKKKKKRMSNKYREDNLFEMDKNLSMSGHSSKILTDVIETRSFDSNLSDVDDDDDELLGMLEDAKPESLTDENLLDLSLVSKATPRSSSLNASDNFSLTSKTDTTSVGDDTTLVEGKNLISELQRVQGLLGSVLMRKTTPTKTENGALVHDESTGLKHRAASPAVVETQTSLLLLKNEEVERLRGQLHQQAVATSLRQADSSFLQTQLQEKDLLLQEVSKILESVERRQVQLEKENAGWKEDWAKSVANLRAKESECEKTVKLLKGREAEIQQLRKQLEEMKASNQQQTPASKAVVIERCEM